MFAQMLAECQKRFNGPQRGFLGLTLSRHRPAYDPRDQVPDELRPHYAALLDEGRLVWGARVKANYAAYHPGADDLPGIHVYSTDRHYDDRPQDLVDVAPRHPLPRRFTDQREVFLGATIFHRSRMPGGHIAARVCPLVIAPARTPANMILPLPYWPERLVAVWDHLDEALAGLPVQSTSLEIARAVPKGPVPEGPTWDVTLIPIMVTPAAAQAFRAACRANGIHGVAYLCLEIRSSDDGVERCYADIGPRMDGERELAFPCNGVRVVVRKDQVDRLRGATVDYERSLYGTGFKVRAPHGTW